MFGNRFSYMEVKGPPGVNFQIGKPYISKSIPIVISSDLKPKKKEGYMKELITDAKGFIKEHKSLFYWIALIALADHFIFEGTFRDKLKSIVQKMIGKLEAKVDNAS